MKIINYFSLKNYLTNNFRIAKNWVTINGLSVELYLIEIIGTEPSFIYDLQEV